MDNQRQQLVDNIRIAIAHQAAETEILQAAIELLDGFSENYHWTGIYMLRDNILEVGPYIGPKTEHVKIDLNSGICGAAASRKETVIVDDVTSDERFLACSTTTRSEIVVPLMDGSECLGEIDIDSDRSHNFTGDDRKMLEATAEVIVQRLKAIR